MDCRSVARYMTGVRSGESYPCNSLYPVQIDNGLSFANVDARRDANFDALREIRNMHFAVHCGCIFEW